MVQFPMTVLLTDFEWQQNVQQHGESRDLSATAEHLVRLSVFIKCHFSSASGTTKVCTKIINNILVRNYYFGWTLLRSNEGWHRRWPWV